MTKTEFQEAIKGMSKCTVFFKGERKYSSYKIIIENCKDIVYNDNNFTPNRYWYGTLLYGDILSVVSGIVKEEKSVQFGSDPELFFTKDSEMVPSTAVLLQDTPFVTRDGFQVELHPTQSTCRQLAGSNMRACLDEAYRVAKKCGAKLSFDLSYRVNDKVWKNTPRETKQFGCSPTENIYAKKNHLVSGQREKFRAGGGHIHIGGLEQKEKDNLPTIIKLCDIIAGNTMVLLDRDPNNITRRKNYGRAGEYRPKPYGFEYRVLSNFWLKHYVLWSLASGLVRNAVNQYRAGNADKIISLFDMKDIRNAINNNDKELAMQNFMKYVGFLEQDKVYTTTGITKLNYIPFIEWVTMKDPLKKLGKMTDQAILARWRNLYATSEPGFESFISNNF